MARSDAPAFLYNHLRLGLDIKGSHFSTQAFRHQVELYFLPGNMKIIGFKKDIEHLFVVVAQGTQQNSRRQLATAVNTYKYRILGIELHIQPGTTVGNNPCGEQQLARGMGFALVMIEEHTRRTMQL